MASANEAPRAPIRIWALLGARAGDNDQVVALADALGLPFETKQLKYNALNRAGPRLLGPTLASLTASSRAAILAAEPPPDLTISTGHRSVPVVRALRHRSGGRTRSIHVGFPRVSPAEFDLVIATPQYPMKDHPRLLRIPYALTRAAVSEPRPAHPALAHMNSPRRVLLVGGPTLFWDLDERQLKATLGAMLDAATKEGGSVLVSTSARTPDRLSAEIEAMLDNSPVGTALAQPGRQPDYASLLASADSFHVTADSVSMVSDAIWTGKPIALVPIRKSLSGELVFGMMDAVRPGVRVYPQDLRYFWRALAELGINDRLAIPRTSTAEVMQAVLERTRAVIDPIVSAASACS